jgi:DNA-binding protein H-NS
MPKQKWNLAGMSVTELIDMRRQLDSVLGEKITRERTELQTRLEALNSLQGGARPARAVTRPGRRANGRTRSHPLKGTKAPIKYRGPNGETWSGRGLAPRWLAELERKGKNRDSYLIQKG